MLKPGGWLVKKLLGRRVVALSYSPGYNSPYTTSRLPLGRALPPWTDGSAHHFSAKRRTP